MTSPRALHLPTARLLSGLLACVLLCGVTLWAGIPKTPGTPIGAAGAPHFKANAYPKDCHRAGEQRWRCAGDGDDYDPPPAAVVSAALLGMVTSRTLVPHRQNRLRTSLSQHRPQAARAPPVV